MLSPQSPYRGRGRGYSSPRRGRGRGSPYSSNRPNSPRFETQRVDFHDDQVRDLLMSSDNKFLTEIKQKFPGVSSIDLEMKNGIAFSGSSGAVKGAMMFLFHQLQKRHRLQYPQIRDVAMNISGRVAQGVRSPSQSPQPNNNQGDHLESEAGETLTGANTEPIVKKRKEIAFPNPVSAKNLEPYVETKSNNTQKSYKAIKINMKSSPPTNETKKPSAVKTKNDEKPLPNKPSPEPYKSEDGSRTAVNVSIVNKEKDENANANTNGESSGSDHLKPVENVAQENVELSELETWKNNFKELQEKCREMGTRLQNEVQATQKEVVDKDMTITEKDKTIREKETENENLRKALEDTKGKVKDALSQCKQFFEKSEKNATILKEREARITELEERLAGRSGTEEVIIKKEVGAEEQENIKIRKENHELTKRLRIIEDKYNGKKRLIYIRDLEIKELYKETARLNQELGKEVLDCNGVMTVDLTTDTRDQSSDQQGNTPKE